MAKLLKAGVLRKRDNILRDWRPYKFKLFQNGFVQMWYGEKFDQFVDEFNIKLTNEMYFSKKNKKCLVLIHRHLLHGWKLKLKGSDGELLGWVKSFLQFANKISRESRKQWTLKIQQHQICLFDLDKTYRKLLDIPDGKYCKNILPELEVITDLMADLDIIVTRLSSKNKKLHFKKHQIAQLTKLQKGVKTTIVSYIERYIQLFVTDEDMEVLSAMMEMLQLAAEIDVLTRRDLTEDERMNKIIKAIDAILITGIERSIHKFIDAIDSRPNNCKYAQMILDKMDDMLKLHATHYAKIFEEFFVEFHLFEYIGDLVSHPLSSMLMNLIDTILEIDDKEEIILLGKSVKTYRKIMALLKVNYTEKKQHDIHVIECETLEMFINYEIDRLSSEYTLGLIENAVENNEWNMDKSYSDKKSNIHYTDTVLDTFNIIDPIISNLMSFPVEQYQVIQIVELFASFMSHYLITLNEQIMDYLHDQKHKENSVISSSALFLMIGDLTKLRVQALEYLKTQQFDAKFTNTIRTKRRRYSIENQYEETVYSKLKCKTTFLLISETMNDIQKSIANNICEPIANTIYDHIWNDDSRYSIESNDMQKFNKIGLKHISMEFDAFQNNTTQKFCHGLYMEVYIFLFTVLANILRTPPNDDETAYNINVLMKARHYIKLMKKHMKVYQFDVARIEKTNEHQMVQKLIEKCFTMLNDANMNEDIDSLP